MVFSRQTGGGANPQAGARRAGPPAGAGGGGYQGGGGERGPNAQSAWQQTVTMYDSWHSSLEVGVKVEFYKSQLTLTLAPIEKGKEGDDYEIRAGEQRYNRDDNLMAVLKPEDAVLFAALLDSFMAGSIQQAVLPLGREDGKRLVLAYADAYYDPGHRWYGALQGSVVFSIERDARDGGRAPVDEKTITFFCRPRELVLDDRAVDPATNEPTPSALYPEMMVLAEFVRGFLAGLPRLDFASVRLLDRPAGARASSSESSGAQPVRRINQAPGPGLARPAAAGPQRAAQAPGRQEGAVSDEDIVAGLGGGGDLDQALDDDMKAF